MHKFKCPLCKSVKTKHHLTAFNTHGNKLINGEEEFVYYKCKRCGSIFLTNVKIDKNFYEKYYDKRYYSNEGIKVSLGKNITLCTNKLKQRLINKHINQRGKIRILDIGCGFGEFLDSLDTDRYEKFGTEVSKECIKNCRQKGIKIFAGDLDEIDFKNTKFDVVTMWHVIEHLQNPEKSLHKIKKILNKNGILVLSSPNAYSRTFAWTGKNWFHLDAPRHLIIPSSKALEILGERTKLPLVKVLNSFWEFPTDLFWSVWKKPYALVIYLFYPIFKIFNKDTIIAIYKK